MLIWLLLGWAEPSQASPGNKNNLTGWARLQTKLYPKCGYKASNYEKKVIYAINVSFA